MHAKPARCPLCYPSTPPPNPRPRSLTLQSLLMALASIWEEQVDCQRGRKSRYPAHLQFLSQVIKRQQFFWESGESGNGSVFSEWQVQAPDSPSQAGRGTQSYLIPVVGGSARDLLAAGCMEAERSPTGSVARVSRKEPFC